MDRCLDIIKSLNTFTISHIPREENSRANCLAQQASGYQISREKFFILEKPMLDVVNSNVDLLAINLLKDAAGSCSIQQ